MTLTLEGKVKTRDGRPARIICTDVRGDQPIAALILDPRSDSEFVSSFYEDGRANTGGECPYDLIPDTTEVRYVWASEHVLNYPHKTPEGARSSPAPHSPGLIKLTLENGKIIAAEVVGDD